MGAGDVMMLDRERFDGVDAFTQMHEFLFSSAKSHY